MFKKIKKTRNNLKAVFATRISFSSTFEKEVGKLEEGGTYYFPNNKHENEITYLEIQSFLIKIIEEDLKPFLSKTTELEIIDLRLTGSYNGSIELVFAILFNSYQFIAGLKDFYDNIRLIRNHSNRFIKQRIESRFGPYFSVNTDVEYPSTDRFEEFFWLNHKRGILPYQNESEISKRDGLFYYLLVSNIVLVILLGVLVFKAVKSFYGF
jgi:hypothetical protein